MHALRAALTDTVWQARADAVMQQLLHVVNGSPREAGCSLCHGSQ